jgi:hypothetical protein
MQLTSETLNISIAPTEDTGWKYAASARPQRGLHDYERFLIFSRPLTAEEEQKVNTFIHTNDNPGYCWWSFRHLGNGKYRLTSTCDSSD